MALTSLNLQPAGSARRSNVGLIKVKLSGTQSPGTARRTDHSKQSPLPLRRSL